MPSRASLKITDDEIRESLEGAQLKLQRERGTDLTIFSPRAMRHGPPHRRRRREPGMVADLQRPDPSRLHALPEELHRRLPVAAVAGRVAGQLHRGARALREGARLRRLQPQSRSVRRLLDRAAAHRPLVVPIYEKMVELDVPAMVHVSASCNPALPRHRRALHQRRHHGVHAAHHGRPVQGFPDAEADHPAWRRRGAVPLGPLPRPGAQQQAAAARRDDEGTTSCSTPASTTSPASICSPRWCRSTTSCSPPRWSARCAATIRRPASRSTTPSATSTTRRACRPPTRRRFSRTTPTGPIRGSRTPSPSRRSQARA